MKRSGKPWASDTELVAEILRGSEEHFELLYDTYFRRVYSFALKRLRDPGEAEDVTQEVFLTLIDALKSYRGQSSLLVWIFGVTRNKVNRRFRKASPPVESLVETGPGELAGPELPCEVTLDARRMLQKCEEIIENELSPVQRRIFHLKHLRRLSIRAIAEALGKSEDSVKAQLYRIRRTIAEGTPGLEALLQR